MIKKNKGYYGKYGGRFVPEILVNVLDEIEEGYKKFKKDKGFKEELAYYLKEYVGRPTPLYFAQRLTNLLKGAKIYLKREDLAHLGAHKINNAIGQALLAKKMGKKKIIAETGAGQHGVATAAAAALFDLECKIFMGKTDIQRQSPNVFRMKILGAEVIEVDSGSKTLKDAINEAIRYWVANSDDTYYLIGSVVGPHPYPLMVRDFQSVIGVEIKRQIKKRETRPPDYMIACVGGGSNAMGMFAPFMHDKNFDESIFIGVEAAGKGIDTGEHCATLTCGCRGVLHGSLSYVLSDPYGQIMEAYSISAGLDYPGVGPEHAYLKDKGRVRYETATDTEALKAFKILAETEGIICALESAHAVAYAIKTAPTLLKDKTIIINLSGRGDKDLDTIMKCWNQ